MDRRWSTILGALTLGLACGLWILVGFARSGTRDGLTAWSQEECVAAIRQLIAESEDYPVVFDRATNYDDREGPTLFRFHGAETPGGRLDRFEVDPARRLVLEASRG
jgi:hypothetical protein